MMTTIHTHGWLRGPSSARARCFGGGGAGVGGAVAVVLGESLVLIVTGAPPVTRAPALFGSVAELGALEFGLLGGLSGNLKFLFSGQDLERYRSCYRKCVESSLQ